MQFLYFREDIIKEGAENDCQSLYGCFKLIVGYGFKNPWHEDTLFTYTLGNRLLLDMVQFAVLIIIITNLLFGIILDTFSEMNADKAQRERDIKERCFICGIDKLTFDRSYDGPDGFKKHVEEEHNMWSYLYFIIRIWELDRDEDDGLELRVRKCLETNDISWFPMNKAMRFVGVLTEEEILEQSLLADIHSTEAKLLEEFRKFQSDTRYAMGNVIQSLNEECRKIQRNAVPEPRVVDLQIDTAYDSARTRTEDSEDIL